MEKWRPHDFLEPSFDITATSVGSLDSAARPVMLGPGILADPQG